MATIILSSGHKNSNSSNVSQRHESYESRGAYEYVTIETLEASKRLGRAVQHKARENARHKKCEVQEFGTSGTSGTTSRKVPST